MPDSIIIALITAAVSLLVSLGTLISSRRALHAERQRLERQLERQFTDKLYSLRLKSYPAAFESTDLIRRRAKPQCINPRNELLSVLRKLNEWKNGEVSLILSRKSLETFYKLRESLGKKPGDGEIYTEQQVEKIFTEKFLFRSRLRQDLGFLYGEDQARYDTDNEPNEA